jgi:hypothetical protein
MMRRPLVVESAARSAVVVGRAMLATRTEALRPFDLHDLAIVDGDANLAEAKIVQRLADELERVCLTRHGIWSTSEFSR